MPAGVRQRCQDGGNIMEKLNENITVNKDGDSNVSTAVMMKVSKISVVSNVALTAF